jgi:hypothetical protein
MGGIIKLIRVGVWVWTLAQDAMRWRILVRALVSEEGLRSMEAVHA